MESVKGYLVIGSEGDSLGAVVVAKSRREAYKVLIEEEWIEGEDPNPDLEEVTVFLP